MVEDDAQKLQHDSLTGLPSRVLLAGIIELELAHARRNNSQVTLFHLDPFPISDIDRLFGYKTGDDVLKQIAVRLKDSVRESDTVIRMDADEFAVLMPTVGKNEVNVVVDKVVTALEVPFEVGTLCINIGVMMGIATYPNHCANAEEMMRGALIAVKQSKREQIQLVHYDGASDYATSEHLKIFGDLRKAVREGGLSLVYQPKVSLETGKVHSVEALLRWLDSSVPVDVFIQLAEKTGLICEITRSVVQMVAVQMANWAEQGIYIKVAINISTRDLLDKSFISFLVDTFTAHSVDSSLVVIEVTETAVMTHAELAIERLDSLRDYGFGVAIDDFGTGYSSLAYLRRLPASELKIDRQFIHGLLTDRRDMKLVRAMISLAHEFDLYVVAEGVENQEEADLLRKLGCEMMQGYLFSPPVDAQVLISLLNHEIDCEG